MSFILFAGVCPAPTSLLIGSATRQESQLDLLNMGCLYAGDWMRPYDGALCIYTPNALYQAWRSTAGRFVWKTNELHISLAGNDTALASTGQIMFARITATAGNDKCSYTGRSPGACKLGYYSFQYDGWNGKNEKLRFENQLVVPEQSGATGITFGLFPGVTVAAQMFLANNPLPGLIETGLPVNLLANKPANEGWILNPQGTLIGSGYTPHSMPYVNDGGKFSFAEQDSDERLVNPDNEMSTGVTRALIHHLTAQIWQATAAPTIGTYIGQPVTLDLTGLLTPDFRYMKRVSVNCIAPLHAVGNTLGQTGIYKYGCYAFQYGESYGPLHFFNQANTSAVPEYQGATGLWYTLQPGITGEATVTSAMHEIENTVGPNGLPINFVEGVSQGLVFA